MLWNQSLIEVLDIKTRRVSKFSNKLVIKLCKYRILLLIFFGLDYRGALLKILYFVVLKIIVILYNKIMSKTNNKHVFKWMNGLFVNN